MPRHKVQNHTDIGFVRFINEILQILQATHSWRRREEAVSLITPWHIQQVFRNRQHLNVGVAHFLNVRNQLIR